MSASSSPPPQPPASGKPRREFRPALALLLAGLTLLIVASVILTDILSPRVRPATSTPPAAGSTP